MPSSTSTGRVHLAARPAHAVQPQLHSGAVAPSTRRTCLRGTPSWWKCRPQARRSPCSGCQWGGGCRPGWPERLRRALVERSRQFTAGAAKTAEAAAAAAAAAAVAVAGAAAAAGSHPSGSRSAWHPSQCSHGGSWRRRSKGTQGQQWAGCRCEVGHLVASSCCRPHVIPSLQRGPKAAQGRASTNCYRLLAAQPPGHPEAPATIPWNSSSGSSPPLPRLTGPSAVTYRLGK